jgi:hypothetical protein
MIDAASQLLFVRHVSQRSGKAMEATYNCKPSILLSELAQASIVEPVVITSSTSKTRFMLQGFGKFYFKNGFHIFPPVKSFLSRLRCVKFCPHQIVFRNFRHQNVAYAFRDVVTLIVPAYGEFFGVQWNGNNHIKMIHAGAKLQFLSKQFSPV